METLPLEEEFEKVRIRLKKGWVLFGCVFALFLLAFSLLIVFSSFETRLYYLWLGTPSIVLLSFLPLAVFFFLLQPGIHRKSVLEERMESSQTVLKGTVDSFGETISLGRGEKGKEVVLTLEDGKRCVVYFDPSFGEIPFPRGQMVSLGVVKNVICSYEVPE